MTADRNMALAEDDMADPHARPDHDSGPAPVADPDLQFDPQVMQRFGGNWVVAHGREVIAADPDPVKVRVEAGRKLGIDPDRLVAIAVSTLGAYR